MLCIKDSFGWFLSATFVIGRQVKSKYSFRAKTRAVILGVCSLSPS